jgi:ADP-ribose pyrophosphatase YjhB (NUDIX family)
MIVTTDTGLLKAHVKAHTKKDGTVVKDYERHGGQGSLFSNKHFTGGVHQKIVAPQYGMGTSSHPVTGSLFSQKPAQKPKAYHPKMNDNGKPVGIYSPNQQTDPSTWHDPKKTATFVPGGACPAELNGLALSPWKDHPTTDDDWDYVEGQMEDLVEPVMHLKQGLKPASGCIIKEPDGRVWVVSPTNQFGGKNTFPKGKAEEDMSWQANAIKEVFEESGLKVKIIGLVGDVERTTSVTRYYQAVRVGGTPVDCGWESQATHLVPAADLHLHMDGAADIMVVKKMFE